MQGRREDRPALWRHGNDGIRKGRLGHRSLHAGLNQRTPAVHTRLRSREPSLGIRSRDRRVGDAIRDATWQGRVAGQ